MPFLFVDHISGLGCSSVVQRLPSVQKALGLPPQDPQEKKENRQASQPHRRRNQGRGKLGNLSCGSVSQ